MGGGRGEDESRSVGGRGVGGRVIGEEWIERELDYTCIRMRMESEWEKG